MNLKYTFIAANSVFAGIILATSAHALTLPEALQHVLDHNPNILAAKSNIVQTNEDIAQARASILPQLDAKVSQDFERRNTNTRTSYTSEPRSYSLTLSQPLYAGGALQAAVSGAKNLQAAAQASYHSTVQSALYNTVDAYMDVLVAENTVKQRENLVKALSKQLEATQIRFREGDVTKTDVAQAQARLAQAQAGIVGAQGSLETARSVLSKHLGFQPDDNLIWPLQNPMEIPLAPKKDDELRELVLKHPDLENILQQLSAANYQIEIEKASRLPELNADASVTRSENSASGDSDVAQVGLTLSIPLYHGGGISSSIRQAQAAKDELTQTYEQTLRALKSEFMAAQQAYFTAKSNYGAFQAALEATRLAAYGIKREADLGERSTLDVLDAQQDVLDAELDLNKSKADVVRNQYRVLAAMGRLTKLPAMEPRQDDLAEIPTKEDAEQDIQ